MGSHSKSSLFLVMLVLVGLFAHMAVGLYEDQVGKFDWRQQFIGSVQHIYRPADKWQDHPNLIVATNGGVLAGLNLRNGDINWRHIVETSPVIGTHEHLQAGFVSNPGQLFDCPVLAINGHGRWIRCWDEEGGLLSEHKLPDTFLGDIEKDPSNYKIFYERYLDEKTSNPMLQVIRVQYSQRIVQAFRYDFKQKEFVVQHQFNAGSWLSPATSCSLITSKNFVCVSANEAALYVLDHSQAGSQFQQISLQNFGLKSDTRPKYLKLHRLPYQDDDSTLTISTKSAFANWKYFAVDLGGDGFVLLKISSESSVEHSSRVQLVKIFPQAIRLTLIPLMPKVEELGGSADDGFAVAVLFQKTEAPKEGGTSNSTKTFVFNLSIFHVGTWTELSSLRADKIVFEFSTANVAPHSTRGKLADRLSEGLSVKTFEVIPVRVSTMSRTGKVTHRYTYRMLLVTEDEVMVLSNLAGKVAWAREEALADITSAVFLDLPLSELDATLEQEYGFEGEEVSRSNIVTLFTKRIRSQIIQLKTLSNRLTQWLVHHIGSAKVTVNKNSRQEQALEDELDAKVDNPVDEDEEGLEMVRDYFGIHKLILVRTRVGKLFALDSLNGNIIWSKYEPSIALSRYVLLFTSSKQY